MGFSVTVTGKMGSGFSVTVTGACSSVLNAPRPSVTVTGFLCPVTVAGNTLACGFMGTVADKAGYAAALTAGDTFPSTMDKWAYERGVELDFSRPGKPTDNAKVESFNGRLRQECLNAHWFLSLEDARRKINEWRQYYNEIRPHSALRWATPAEFAARQGKAPCPAGQLSRNFPL